MDQAIRDHFAEIKELARSHLDRVGLIEEDHTPTRALIRVSGRYERYHVFVTEIISQQARKYRYYVLDDEVVVAGFDNAADPRALRMKYGHIDRENTGELVPHLHLDDKTRLQLTDEVEFVDFIIWLKKHISLVSSSGGE